MNKKPEVLIIGAGASGLAAAAELAEKGVGSLIIEKDIFPGGHAAGLPCMAAPTCMRCNACLVDEQAAALIKTSIATIKCRTSITACDSSSEGIKVSLSTEAEFINPDKCVDCGICYEICPQKGRALKMSSASVGPRFGLDEAECFYFRDQSCTACKDVCPVGAIDLAASERTEDIHVRAVLLACGYEPFDATQKPRYGYGRLKDVVTALELDKQLKNTGAVLKPSDGVPPDSLAFIQCVGSRDKSLSRDYCSRVCCGFAMRLANLAIHRRPETKIAFFYMDIQNTGRDFNRFYNELKDKIEFIQGVPGEITAGENGSLIVPFINGSTGAREVREFDMASLSIGLGPPDGGLIDLLGLEANADGFPLSNPDIRIFAAGSATGPMNIAESQADSRGAAARIAAFIGEK